MEFLCVTHQMHVISRDSGGDKSRRFFPLEKNVYSLVCAPCMSVFNRDLWYKELKMDYFILYLFL
jgi:hypothetical protein